MTKLGIVLSWTLGYALAYAFEKLMALWVVPGDRTDVHGTGSDLRLPFLEGKEDADERAC